MALTTDEALGVLQELLHDNHTKHDLVLKNEVFLLNHFPQDLVRMYKAKASPEQMRQWYKNYIEYGSGYAPVQPLTGVASITKENYKDYFGQKNWKGWMHFFDEEAKSMTTEQLLLKYLDPKELGNCVTAYLLHGLISVGYGIEIKSNEMISEGFSQIAAHYVEPFESLLQEFSPSRKSRISTLEEIESILDEISKDSRSPEAAQHLKLDKGDLLQLSPIPLLIDYESKLHLGPCQTKEDIEKACDFILSASIIFLSRGGGNDFAILHSLTSAPALKTLCLTIPSLAINLIRQWWIASLVIYIVRGAPKSQLKWEKEIEFSIIDEFREKAIIHNDEHVLKGVIVCYENFKSSPQNLRPNLLKISQILLSIPSPPGSKGLVDGEHKWIYPGMPHPNASINSKASL